MRFLKETSGNHPEIFSFLELGRLGHDRLQMIYEFADCSIDTERQELIRAGDAVPIEPQVLRLVIYLAEHAGKVIGRDELVAAIWDGRIVSDSTISTRINSVRRAIGDDDRSSRMLETLSKRGYRLAVDVKVGGGDQVSALTAPVPDVPSQTIRAALSADKTMIAYATTGQGPPLLRAGQFLTHLNMDWDSQIRRPMLERLGQHFRLARYDQRGTGLSAAPETDFSLDRLVEDLLAVADDAGLEQFPIFANSQGVPISIAFAARYPDRVSRMVLYGGFLQGRSVRQGGKFAGQAETLLDLIAEGWGNPGSAFGRAYATLFMPDASADQIDDMSRMQLASATPETAIALRRAIDAFDVLDMAEKVRAPVLVAHSSEDSMNPVSQSQQMAAMLPEAELLVLNSRNHVPLPETKAWEQLITASIAFLAAD